MSNQLLKPEIEKISEPKEIAQKSNSIPKIENNFMKQIITAVMNHTRMLCKIKQELLGLRKSKGN